MLADFAPALLASDVYALSYYYLLCPFIVYACVFGITFL